MSKADEKGGRKPRGDVGSGVISFSRLEPQRSQETRRRHDRFLVNDLLGVFAEVPGGRVLPVEVLNVSREGLDMRVRMSPEAIEVLRVGREASIRFYFTRDSFFRVAIAILHTTQSDDDGQTYERHGCRVETADSSYQAFLHFVLFLEAYLNCSETESERAAA